MLLHPILRFKRDDEEEQQQPPQQQQLQPQPQQQQGQKESQKEKAKGTEQLSAIIEEPDELESVIGSENANQSNNSKEKDQIMEEKKIDIEISRQVQDIGNVFQDSKIYFEYIIRKDLQQRKEYNDLKHVIFQVQIHYVRMDGAKMMRVITQKKPISRNKEEVLSHLNMDVIAANASRKSARLCEEGDYESARANFYTNALWMNRNTVNESQQRSTLGFVSTNLVFDREMREQQENEMVNNTTYTSKGAQKKSRSRKRGDIFSTHMYSSKQL